MTRHVKLDNDIWPSVEHYGGLLGRCHYPLPQGRLDFYPRFLTTLYILTDFNLSNCSWTI